MSKIPGLIIDYLSKDCVTLDDEREARALMPCGHVISRDSMTALLSSLVSEKKYIIRCPGAKPDGSQCLGEWPYELCKKVGVLTK